MGMNIPIEAVEVSSKKKRGVYYRSGLLCFNALGRLIGAEKDDNHPAHLVVNQ